MDDEVSNDAFERGEEVPIDEKTCVDDVQQEVLVVGVGDTHVDPRAVVIVLDAALAAGAAVSGAVRFDVSAFVAVLESADLIAFRHDDFAEGAHLLQDEILLLQLK